MWKNFKKFSVFLLDTWWDDGGGGGGGGIVCNSFFLADVGPMLQRLSPHFPDSDEYTVPHLRAIVNKNLKHLFLKRKIKIFATSVKRQTMI